MYLPDLGRLWTCYPIPITLIPQKQVFEFWGMSVSFKVVWPLQLPFQLPYSQQWFSLSTASHKHTLTSTVHTLKWAKNRGEISLLTDYRIFWYPHWVSRLSQKWLLKVKNGMKSDNNRSHVSKSLHLGLCSLGISIHTSLTLSFKCLVQISSPFTLANWIARLSQRIQ